MTNHMHVASHYPDAYEGRINYNGRELSIVEIATARELPPILKRYGDWVVTTQGIECLTVNYPIGKGRLEETDWFEHMGEKSWVNMNDFRDAFYAAEDMVRLGLI